MKIDKSQFAKNLKYLRESLGFKRPALAERLYSTKSIITKLERGEYSPSVEQVDTFAQFFQVPAKWLCNEDLSDYSVKYEKLSIENMKVAITIMFPLVSNDEALKDSYFKEAYEKIRKFFDDCLSGKPAMTSLFDSSLELFHKSFDENGTPEAFVNLFCILLMFQIAPGFESLRSLGHKIFINRKNANDVFNNHYFYDTNIVAIENERNEDRKKRKEAYKEFQELFCDGIGILKRKLGYADLADYLFALTYLLDFVDNSFDQQTNVMIGAELLVNYEQQGNQYAKNFADLSSFFCE